MFENPIVWIDVPKVKLDRFKKALNNLKKFENKKEQFCLKVSKTKYLKLWKEKYIEYKNAKRKIILHFKETDNDIKNYYKNKNLVFKLSNYNDEEFDKFEQNHIERFIFNFHKSKMNSDKFLPSKYFVDVNSDGDVLFYRRSDHWNYIQGKSDIYYWKIVNEKEKIIDNNRTYVGYIVIGNVFNKHWDSILDNIDSYINNGNNNEDV